MRKIISWRNKNKFKNWFPEIPSLDVKKQEHFYLFIFLLHRRIWNREHSFLRRSDNSCFYVTYCVTFYHCMSCFTLDIDPFAIVLIRLFTLNFGRVMRGNRMDSIALSASINKSDLHHPHPTPSLPHTERSLRKLQWMESNCDR